MADGDRVPLHDRDLDKSEVVSAVIRAGLDHLPVIVDRLRDAQAETRRKP